MRRHRLIAIAAASAAVLIAFFVWLFYFSSVFGVSTVRVVGNKTLSATEIAQAAAIEDGTPLLRLDGGAAARRVEALPQIGTVSVDTQWPSTVVITVTERTPVGYRETDKGFVLIDKDGKQYRTVDKAPALPLFVVPASNPDDPDAAKASAAVAAIAAALPDDLRTKLASIQALDPNAVTLLMTDGRVVRFGDSTRVAEKIRVLTVLLRQQNTSVDVSDPDLPFTR